MAWSAASIVTRPSSRSSSVCAIKMSIKAVVPSGPGGRDDPEPPKGGVDASMAGDGTGRVGQVASPISSKRVESAVSSSRGRHPGIGVARVSVNAGLGGRGARRRAEQRLRAGS
jgi:hypothetical protein